MLKEKVNELNMLSESLTEVELLHYIAEHYGAKAVFTTSFGYEDQVITDMIFKKNLNINIITLDTGRLFKETYKVFSQTIEQYKKNIQVYYPKHEKVEPMLSSKGPFSFYNSIEDRKECCSIRKVEPLNRALKGIELWITGIRAEQSPNREGMTFFELDEQRQLIKFNPLLKYSLEEVIDYAKSKHVPYNILHDKGFVSIGCEPCTRAIKPGDDFRAGRWWWEDHSKKECGLHTHS